MMNFYCLKTWQNTGKSVPLIDRWLFIVFRTLTKLSFNGSFRQFFRTPDGWRWRTELFFRTPDGDGDGSVTPSWRFRVIRPSAVCWKLKVDFGQKIQIPQLPRKDKIPYWKIQFLKNSKFKFYKIFKFHFENSNSTVFALHLSTVKSQIPMWTFIPFMTDPSGLSWRNRQANL